MAENTGNKLAAKIIKAEMMNDAEGAEILRKQLEALRQGDLQPHKSKKVCYTGDDHKMENTEEDKRLKMPPPKQHSYDPRVKKFIQSTKSLEQSFMKPQTNSSSFEAKMFLETAALFTKDDLETKHFSTEIDDSQTILSKAGKFNVNPVSGPIDSSRYLNLCERCVEKLPSNILIQSSELISVSLTSSNPFLSDMSDVIIRNNDHYSSCFVASSASHQQESEIIISKLRRAWKTRGYRVIIMETYFRNRKSINRNETISCCNHFQLNCIPIKDKYYERARMCFKQAIIDSGEEWSMNKKLILTNERKIQRCLPQQLSYFWVCFDDLTNGYAHVIENEDRFSRYFGLEVLSSIHDRDFHPAILQAREDHKAQLDRCRQFKFFFSECEETCIDQN